MLTITQRPQNGLLKGLTDVIFFVHVNNVRYDICIQQQGVRIITIDANDDNIDNVRSVYDNLETLLMLFDGQFYQVISVLKDGTDITDYWNNQTLPSHISADFMIESAGRLLDYDTVLNREMFYKWSALNDQLDLVHKMVLYCLSDVKMPKDLQCAFMVEAFKGLCKPIHEHDKTFAPSLFTGKDPSLKMTFLAVVDRYGSDIWSREINQGGEKIAQILVNMRNKIAHINSIDEQKVLPREVCVWYIVKLSLLYRVALLDLLGIPQDVYSQAIDKYIQFLNERPGMDEFIKTLTKDQPATDDSELKIEIYSLLYTFIYSTAIYKVLYSKRKQLQSMNDDQAHLWAAVSDNCLQQAVVDWRKVFGSYDERTHYKKINPDYTKDFEKSVVENKIDLAAYTKGMKTFRDTFIAHLDKEKKRKPIPKLEPALTICYLYEEMVICGDPYTWPFGLKQFYLTSQMEIKQYFDFLGILH